MGLLIFYLSCYFCTKGLSVFRCYCSATLLHGKVVVVGGYDGQSLLATLEEYDEANNTWTVKTNMPTARCDAGFAIIKYRNSLK